MATIGSLAVNIVATTDKFTSGLNNARKGLGTFVKSIGAAQIAAVGLAVTGLGAIIKSALDAGGALFDLSKKLNISTDALGALDYAADQLGVSTSSLHNSISIMTRKLGEYRAGSKSAVAAFDSLGVSVDSIINLSADKQFLFIVDALNKIPNAADRAAKAQAVFGKGAKELTALIAAGTDEIISFADEAAKLGILIDDKTAEGLDNASDAINKFTATLQGLKLNMVGDFAPEIETALDIITGAVNVLRVAILSLGVAGTAVFEFIGHAIRGLLLLLNDVLPQSLQISMQEATQVVESLTIERRKLQKEIGDIVHGREAGPLVTPTPAAAEAQKKTADNTKKQIQQNDEQTKVLREMRDHIRAGGHGPIMHTAPVGP